MQLDHFHKPKKKHINMKKLLVKNFKTTAIALIGAAVLVAVNFGLIAPEQTDDVTNVAHQLVDSIDVIIASVFAIVLLFSKDADSVD